MRRHTEATLLLVLATLVGRLTLDGGYQSYVKTGLYWPLLLSAAVVAVVGGLTFLEGRGTPEHEHGLEHHDDGHGHGGGRVGALLLVPVLILAVIPPVPLGAFIVERGAVNRTTPPAEYQLPELPAPVDGASDLTIGNLLTRVLWGDPEQIRDVPVRLVGFAMPAPDGTLGQQFLLTRFSVGCCAADGLARQVLVDGSTVPASEEQWFEVVGTWTGDTIDDTYPVIDVISVTAIPTPDQPYEY